MVDFRKDGMVRTVVLAFKQGMSAKGVEQIEVALRVDSIFLIDSAPLALKHVVEQAAHALRVEGHSRFPIRPPAVERNVERAQDAILIIENDELGITAVRLIIE